MNELQTYLLPIQRDRDKLWSKLRGALRKAEYPNTGATKDKFWNCSYGVHNGKLCEVWTFDGVTVIVGDPPELSWFWRTFQKLFCKGN